MVISIFSGLHPLPLGDGPYKVYELGRRIADFQAKAFAGRNPSTDFLVWGELNRTCDVMFMTYSMANRVVGTTGRTIHDIDSMVMAYDRAWIGMTRARLSKALSKMKTMDDLLIPEFKIRQTRYFDLAFAQVSRTEKTRRQAEFDAMTKEQLKSLVAELEVLDDIPF